MKINYPDSLTIQQYLAGTLDTKLMHALEKQALEDPFLFEALEGYSQTSNPGHELSILQRQLHERIMHLQENKKVYDFTWQRLSIAAAAAVMFISAGILFWMNIYRHEPQVASNSKQVEVILTHPDTIKALQQQNSIPKKQQSLVKSKPELNWQTAASNAQARVSENVIENDNVDKASKNANQEPVSTASLAKSVAGVVSDQGNPNTIKAKEEGVPLWADTPQLALNANKRALSEIVIGSGSQKKSNELQPVSGWDSYRAYLKENIRQPKNEPNSEGKVLVGFWVKPNGKLKNIHIIKGLTNACNSEAIRLIKDGPAWKPALDGKSKESKIEITFTPN